MIRSLFGLFRVIASIFLAVQTYPYITRLFRQTGGLYDSINRTIQSWLAKVAGTIVSETIEAQAHYVNSLPLPGFLKENLLSSNSNVFYKAMNVDNFVDYVAGYLTNICINIIGWALALVIVFVLLTVLIRVLDLIAKLPVISTFNKLGGIIVGFAEATIFIWLVHVVIVSFFSSSQYAAINDMVSGSMLAGLFFDYNIILEMLNKIII